MIELYELYQKAVTNIAGAGKFYLKGTDLKTLKFQDGREFNIEDIQAEADRLIAEKLLNDKYNQTTDFILQHYSTIKQQSDQADKEYFSTILKAKGVENLESIVAVKVQNFFAGKTLEEVVEDVADEDKEAYLQLIKVGIRVTWVQMCKAELRKAIAENREPKFPEYPL